MDLRVLKSFVTICKLGNITRASEVLFISQPALTRQLQELEDELGCKLLIRNTRSLTLTESGYLFFQRAEEILTLANQAENGALRKRGVPSRHHPHRHCRNFCHADPHSGNAEIYSAVSARPL